MMKVEISTRIAEANDLPALARLNQAFNGVVCTPRDLQERLADPFCVEQPLVAEVDGRVVGFGALRVVPCVFYPEPYGEVTELYVAEGYRRMGVGRSLLRLAEEIAQSKGVRTLMVMTGKSNRAACRLYQSMGYEQDDLAFSKSLDPT
jgi:ribosomal protein S18 acetylase RimI-like enzyme